MSKIVLSIIVNSNADTDSGFVEEVHTFPAKNALCPKCNGESRTMLSGMRYHAYTQEEFERDFDDNDREAYFNKASHYYENCPHCKGNKVVKVVDTNHLDPEQKKLYSMWTKHQEEIARDLREWAAELRMESQMLGEF